MESSVNGRINLRILCLFYPQESVNELGWGKIVEKQESVSEGRGGTWINNNNNPELIMSSPQERRAWQSLRMSVSIDDKVKKATTTLNN